MLGISLTLIVSHEFEDTDKAYRVGIEHSVLGCTEEEGWGSLNSAQSTLSPGHLTGGHRAPAAQENVFSVHF